MKSGNWIRSLLEERRVKPSTVERIGRSIADAKGDPDFYISHASLADIQAGSIPSIHKIFSLAVCLRVPYEQLLKIFGVDAAELEKRQSVDDQAEAADAVQLDQPMFRFQLPFIREKDLRVTTLFSQNLQDWAVVPTFLRWRMERKRYRYGLIGLEDDSMGDLLPPGSLVEIDTNQNTVHDVVWRTLRERPIYFVQTGDGYSCGWCQQSENDLILSPQSTSSQSVRTFKMPMEASVVGRVVSAWLQFGPFATLS